MIIARTAARSTVGFDDAAAQAYARCGADMIFVEALRSENEVRTLPTLVPAPLLYNVTCSGKSPVLPLARLGALGYRIVIFPADLQLAALHGMRQALAALREKGATPDALRAAFAERDEVVHLDKCLDLLAR